MSCNEALHLFLLASASGLVSIQLFELFLLFLKRNVSGSQSEESDNSVVWRRCVNAKMLALLAV